MNEMRFIETPLAPLPAGHYSQAVVAQGLAFVSGVLPLVPGQGTQLPHGIEAQFRQVFENLSNVLQAANSGLHLLVNVQIFIPDVSLWPSIDAAYRQVMGSHKPARTVVPCGGLHYGAMLEVNAVAIAPHLPRD
ncbi:RidA family protein [Oxalobacteraceae bacterium OM1]|nr:RidA family protein [Oxalobacteraceae bacterium OM1]